MILLNEKQVAEQLQCSVGLLRKWRKWGRGGPPFIRVGRLVRYEQSDLETYLQQNRHGAGLQKKAQLAVVSP